MNGNDGQSTGDARVDAALARFDELAETPLTGHPEIFEDVHRRLQDALAGIEQDPPPGGEDGDRARPDAEAATDGTRTPNEASPDAMPSHQADAEQGARSRGAGPDRSPEAEPQSPWAQGGDPRGRVPQSPDVERNIRSAGVAQDRNLRPGAERDTGVAEARDPRSGAERDAQWSPGIVRDLRQDVERDVRWPPGDTQDFPSQAEGDAGGRPDR